MNLSADLLGLIREWGGQVGSRPDATGIRGTGGLEEPIARDDMFPYDQTGDSTYGQVGRPGAQGVGMGSSGPSHHGITPKDTEHSAWDEVQEAMGTPMNFTQAYRGGQTTTGVPGSSRGWAGNPPKDWDEEPVIEYKTDLNAMDPSAPPTEHVPNTGFPDARGQTDDSIENLLNRIWQQDDNPSSDPDQFQNGSLLPSNIYVVSSPVSGRGGSMRPQPPIRGLMSRDSAWDPLELLAKKL